MDRQASAIESRARASLVGLAVGDALGAPVEFKERGSFPELRDMQPGGYFRLPAGAWTDDTAMALCLAESLLHQPELDARDLLDRFARWLFEDENTSTGKCVGAGQNTFAVLGNYRRTGELSARRMNGRSDGNGAIMRLAPVAIRHWCEPLAAKAIAGQQSRATHASDLSEAACSALASLLCSLIGGKEWSQALVQLAEEPCPAPLHPILAGMWRTKPRGAIKSTGFVLDTLEAALWAVGMTSSFEEAIVAAVNLGGDADTVGAVAGQIAGARYGLAAIPARWTSALASAERIEHLAAALFNEAVCNDESINNDLSALLAHCTAGGRVCPQPIEWDRLWQSLPCRTRTDSGWQPPAPLILAAWHFTSNAEKRRRLAEHIRWAADHDALPAFAAALRTLPADRWHLER